MASVNKVTLLGRIGKDPELRYMPNGDAVCNFSLATSETWKDKNGEKKESVEWHNVTIYRKLGEIAGQYLKKGSQVYLEGKLKTRKWQDKQGNDRYTTEVICDEMVMLGGGDSGQQQDHRPQQGQQEPPRRPPAMPTPVDEFVDDVPF